MIEKIILTTALSLSLSAPAFANIAFPQDIPAYIHGEMVIINVHENSCTIKGAFTLKAEREQYIKWQVPVEIHFPVYFPLEGQGSTADYDHIWKELKKHKQTGYNSPQRIQKKSTDSKKNSGNIAWGTFKKTLDFNVSDTVQDYFAEIGKNPSDVKHDKFQDPKNLEHLAHHHPHDGFSVQTSNTDHSQMTKPIAHEGTAIAWFWAQLMPETAKGEEPVHITCKQGHFKKEGVLHNLYMPILEFPSGVERNPTELTEDYQIIIVPDEGLKVSLTGDHPIISQTDKKIVVSPRSMTAIEFKVEKTK